MKLGALLVALAFAAGAAAAPISIAVQPSAQTGTVGAMLFVDVVASGLDPAIATDLVSAFDVDVTFDQAILALGAVTFGTTLGAPADTIQDALESSPGVIDAFQFSFVSDAGLKLLQPGASVTLFTIAFAALVPGTSAVLFDTTLQYVAGALDFSVDPAGLATILQVENQGGVITVDAAAPNGVPAPGTLPLAASALLALLWRRARPARLR